MATFTDNFTFADTADLSTHTADTLETWTAHGSSTSAFLNRSGVRVFSGSTGLYYSSWTPAGANYDITATLSRITSVGTVAVCGRMDTAAQTFIMARFNSTGPAIDSFKFIAGASTSLGSSTQSGMATGDQLKLELRGTTVNVYYAPVATGVFGLVIGPVTVADAGLQAAGRIGVRGSGSTATIGQHLDAMSAVDATVTATAHRRALLGAGR